MLIAARPSAVFVRLKVDMSQIPTFWVGRVWSNEFELGFGIKTD